MSIIVEAVKFFIRTQMYSRYIKKITNDRHNDGDHLVDIDRLDPLQITCGQENNAFHVAVKWGVSPQADRVQTLLRDYPLLAYQPNNKGDTPLHVAARLGHESFAVVLIEHARAAAAGHSVDYYRDVLSKVNTKGNTALHEAVLNGHFQIAKRLIEEHPGLTDFVNEAGESPLFLAVEGQFYDIASIILDTNPTCSLLGGSGMTVMHAAVICSSPFYVKVGELRFLRSVTKGFDEFVKKVLERCGSEILERADEYGWMPHHHAANIGQSEIFKLFLEAKRSLAYIKDKQGMNALHIAARKGYTEVIRTLLEECPDIAELLDNRERTALHIAVEHKQLSVVRTLSHERAFIDLINEQDNEGYTALHVAALHCHHRIFLCLASNRSTNKRIINKMGATAFQIFAGRSKILGKLGKFAAIYKVYQKFHLLTLQLMARYPRESDETYEETLSKMTQSELQEKNKEQDVKHMQNMNLVVLTLITGAAFQAAITMPGAGKYGTPKGLEAFKSFMYYNSNAFVFSSATMLFHFIISLFSNSRLVNLRYRNFFITVSVSLSIYYYLLAYKMGTKALLSEKKELNSLKSENIDLNDIVPTFCFTVTLLVYFGCLLWL
ncbi:ankyrin repeat-containing protein NPR4-like [Humulus lupulus]|uniref:ankyrin repeat-containing protein NPR4-like n=1 Tax=Humulus lupulus TaxID=3486 RepID=UPI002B40E7AA|nr:ankyrin repeat-containing protein NPR4-like [Humulus lupulus]